MTSWPSSLVDDPPGGGYGVLGISTSDDRLQALLNDCPVGTFLKTEYGRYVYTNEAMSRLVLSSERAAAVRAADDEVLRRGAPVQAVESHRTLEGEVRQFLTCRFPVTTEDGSRYVGGIAVDLTERLELEHELARARDEAVVSARQKSAFLANMSHEIRTPMNGVIGLLGLLLDSPLNADQRDLAQTARSSAEALLTILNDILDFSKIEAGKLDFETLDFDVRTLCESTADLLVDSAQRKSLEIGYVLDSDIPQVLRGDPGRLRQVLLNLMSNALKFTQDGGVLLQVDQLERSEDSVLLQFRVTDTGIGLSAPARESLFHPFTQGDASTTRRFGGTGLGLAISKELVQMMGGEIGVESEQGCGSTFWFTGRFGCQRQESAEAEMPGTGDAPHVLVVEDSVTSRHTIAMQLAAWNVNYDTSDDGVSALAMMRTRAVERAPYDLVIADQHLPGIDGTTLVRLGVANRKDFGSPRFVLMTASHQPLDTATLAELGVGTCLRKPIKPAFLFSAVFGRSMEDRPPAAPALTETPVRHGRAPRVLVADDNVVNQKVALRQLQRLGYAAETVGDGIEVLEAMSRITYDLVLMDCQMPEMDGYETTAHIRRLDEMRGTHVPVIALTASAGESDRQACLNAGMDDFLPKPVRENELAEMLQRWLPHPAIEDPKDN